MFDANGACLLSWKSRCAQPVMQLAAVLSAGQKLSRK
jgi:hypothetical protein